MSPITSEATLSLSQAARHLPRGRDNKPRHCSTLWRWATQGCRGVLLETLLIGGARYTSKEALDRFLEKLNAGSAGSPVRSAPNQPTASRQAQIHASRRKLHSQRIGN